jgi:tetratricopeptide (TPR) repeat protein
VVNDPAVQDQLIARLQEAIPARPVQVVRLRGETTDVLDEVLRQVSPDGPSGPVMVADWGNAAGREGKAEPLLASLNLSRPRWPSTVPVPVVFWLPEHIMGMLIRGAPDFLDWRSDTCRFPNMCIGAIRAFDLIETTSHMDWDTPAEFARERIRELESRLATHQQRDDPVTRTARITWLDELGRRRRLLGRPDEALADLSEALREARSTKLFPLSELGGILINLSTVLGDIGKREEALEAAAEAVAIYRSLAAERHDSLHPDLAMSLNSLATCLGDLGRCEEAVAVATEAVAINQVLAADRPDVHMPDLAMSLINLTNSLSGMGREDALITAEEAVATCRELATRRPGSFLNELGVSLTNASVLLSAHSLLEGALSAAREAVAIFRGLAGARPETFLPQLGACLSNLAGRLVEAQRLDEATETVEEALYIQRPLANARAEAFVPQLGRSLGRACSIYQACGKHREAAQAAEEGIRKLKPLFERFSEAFRPLMGVLRAGYSESAKAADMVPDRDLLWDNAHQD